MAHRFQKIGYAFNRNDIDILYQQFLVVADKKKEVKDEDLHELAKEYQAPTLQGEKEAAL